MDQGIGKIVFLKKQKPALACNDDCIAAKSPAQPQGYSFAGTWDCATVPPSGNGAALVSGKLMQNPGIAKTEQQEGNGSKSCKFPCFSIRKYFYFCVFLLFLPHLHYFLNLNAAEIT